MSRKRAVKRDQLVRACFEAVLSKICDIDIDEMIELCHLFQYTTESERCRYLIIEIMQGVLKRPLTRSSLIEQVFDVSTKSWRSKTLREYKHENYTVCTALDDMCTDACYSCRTAQMIERQPRQRRFSISPLTPRRRSSDAQRTYRYDDNMYYNPLTSICVCQHCMQHCQQAVDKLERNAAEQFVDALPFMCARLLAKDAKTKR